MGGRQSVEEPKELCQEASVLFRKLDNNLDKVLTKQEWSQAFEFLDENKDGSITRKEWYLKNGTTAIFDAINKGNPAIVQRAEWLNAFEDIDSSKDGAISLEEWLLIAEGTNKKPKENGDAEKPKEGPMPLETPAEGSAADTKDAEAGGEEDVAREKSANSVHSVEDLAAEAKGSPRSTGGAETGFDFQPKARKSSAEEATEAHAGGEEETKEEAGGEQEPKEEHKDSAADAGGEEEAPKESTVASLHQRRYSEEEEANAAAAASANKDEEPKEEPKDLPRSLTQEALEIMGMLDVNKDGEIDLTELAEATAVSAVCPNKDEEPKEA